MCTCLNTVSPWRDNLWYRISGRNPTLTSVFKNQEFFKEKLSELLFCQFFLMHQNTLAGKAHANRHLTMIKYVDTLLDRSWSFCVISFSVGLSSHLPNDLFLSVYFITLNFTLFCIQGVPEAVSSNQLLPKMRKQILKSGLGLWRWSYCSLSQISGSNLDQGFGHCPLSLLQGQGNTECIVFLIIVSPPSLQAFHCT